MNEHFNDPFNIEEVPGYMDLLSEGLIIPAKRIQVNGYRFYYHTEDTEHQFGVSQFHKSTTTVGKFMPREFTKGLDFWRGSVGNKEADSIMNDRSLYGTLLHILFAEYLRRVQMHGRNAAALYREEVYASACLYAEGFRLGNGWVRRNILELQKDLIALNYFVRVYEFEPYLIEKTLFHPDLKYAGTIDICGKMWIGDRYGEKAQKALQLKDPRKAKRAFVQIDLKSGKAGQMFPSDELQLALNADLLEANFPKVKIAASYKLAPKDWKTSPSFNLIEAKRTRWAKKKTHILELAEEDLAGVDEWPYMTALEYNLGTEPNDSAGEEIEADEPLNAEAVKLKKRTVREAVESYEVGTPDFTLADSHRLKAESAVANLVKDSHDRYFTVIK